jgi:RHS repeat-associated protein
VKKIVLFAFGECRFSTGTIPTDKLFTGQRLDSTGLYYYGARYYDPEIGRFISADIIVSNPANPQSLNRYSYCLNNPLKYVDPTGHEVIIGGTNVTSFYNYINDPMYMGMGPSQNILDLVADSLFQAYDAFRAYSLENAQNYLMAKSMERSDRAVNISFGSTGSSFSAVSREGNNINMTIDKYCQKSDSTWLGLNVIQGAATDIVNIYPDFINSSTTKDLLGMIPLERLVGKVGDWASKGLNTSDILDTYYVDYKHGDFNGWECAFRMGLSVLGYGPPQGSVPAGLIMLMLDLRVAQNTFNTGVKSRGVFEIKGGN